MQGYLPAVQCLFEDDCLCADAEVCANMDAFQSLQARHLALQTSLAEQAVSSKALQQSLQQQLCHAEEQMQVCPCPAHNCGTCSSYACTCLWSSSFTAKDSK